MDCVRTAKAPNMSLPLPAPQTEKPFCSLRLIFAQARSALNSRCWFVCFSFSCCFIVGGVGGFFGGEGFLWFGWVFFRGAGLAYSISVI